MDIPSAFCLVALVPGAFYLFLFCASFLAKRRLVPCSTATRLLSLVSVGLYLDSIRLLSSWSFDDLGLVRT